MDNNLKSYKILDKIDSHVDRMYGLYGCIANLIRSIILSNSSHKFKMKLFNLLFLRINSELAINKFEYKIETKKDKLVRYFCQNFPHKKDTFVLDFFNDAEDIQKSFEHYYVLETIFYNYHKLKHDIRCHNNLSLIAY